MLRNLFFHIPPHRRKYILFTTFTLLLFKVSYATTQNYRLILTENPSNSIHIGWELIGGCPDLQQIYYDTIDHGQDTASYAMRASITASNFHQGMENYFCLLKNLLPDTKYYLVIGEDDGISPRLIAKTFSIDDVAWKAGWTTANSLASPALSQLVDLGSLDFILLGGLASLSTEDAWRRWFASYQPPTYEQILTPIIVTNASLPDVQYLFNVDGKGSRSYQINHKTILLVSSTTNKIRGRYWKSVPTSAKVLWYSISNPEKISEKVDIVLTPHTRQDGQSPNVFNFSEQQSAVVIEQQSEMLRVLSVDHSVLMELFFN